MKERYFVNSLHTSTKRDYKSRVMNVDKAEVSELAIQWGFDYWDGSEILDMVAISMMEDGKK